MSYGGIPYFPHECIAPTKIRLVQSKFGLLGYGVIYKLYEKIFLEGYYIDWNDEICDIFAYEDCRIKTEIVKSIIDLCLEKGVFDRNIYEKYSVLTSFEIQSKFYNAAKNRHNFSFDENLCLIDIEKLNEDTYNKNNKNSYHQDREHLFDLYKNAISEGCGVDFICSNTIFKPWLEQFDPLVILFAFSMCVRKRKENENYLFGILGNWKGAGVIYLSDIDDPLLRTPDFMKSHPELQSERMLDFMCSEN